MSTHLEHLLIVGRGVRLQQEHLYQGARIFMEMQTCLYHLRIVEHHEGFRRQILGKVVEHILPYYTFIIYKELRVVTLRHRKLSDAVVFQLVVIITDMYLFCIHFLYFTSIPL